MQKIIYPIFSIIIPTYNGAEYITKCLDSILLSKYPKFEVLVCDDTSTDNSYQLLLKYQSRDSRIQVYKNTHNLGAAATRNRAARLAKGKILVFLDIDTVVESAWLDEIRKGFENDPKTAAVQCTVLDMQKPNLIQHAGGLLMRETGWLVPITQWHIYSPYVAKTDIVAVSCALAVKKSSFDQVQGFDEKEAIHSEDVDFSWRLWLSGNTISSCPGSVVYHWQKSLAQRANMHATLTTIYFHLAKNSMRSMVKNYSAPNLIRYLPLCITILSARALVFIFTRQSPSAFFGLLLALKWNLDHLRNSLVERKFVQRSRKYSDKALFSQVFINDSLFKTMQKYFL